MTPTILVLILLAVVWLNKNTLYEQFFKEPLKSQNTQSVPSQAEVQPSLTAPVVNQSADTEYTIQDSLENSIAKNEALLLLEQKDQEIKQVKEELEKQKQALRKKQLNRKRQINKLLAKGQQCLKDYHLTTPLNDNAIYYFQKVLDMDPANKKAKKGIKDVVYRYELLARSELDKYHYQKAQQYISTGLGIDADNKRLKELQAEANLLNEPKRAIKKVQNFFKNL